MKIEQRENIYIGRGKAEIKQNPFAYAPTIWQEQPAHVYFLDQGEGKIFEDREQKFRKKREKTGNVQRKVDKESLRKDIRYRFFPRITRLSSSV